MTGLTARELARHTIGREAQRLIEIHAASLRAIETSLRGMEPDVRAALIARCERIERAGDPTHPVALLATMARAQRQP